MLLRHRPDFRTGLTFLFQAPDMPFLRWGNAVKVAFSHSQKGHFWCPKRKSSFYVHRKFIFRKRGRNSPQNVENKTAASGLGNQTSQRLPDFGNGWQYLWQEGLDLKPPFVWCPEVGNTNSRNAPSLVQISLNCNLWTEDFGPDIWVGLLLAEVYLTQIMSISLRLERWLYE